MRVRLSDGTHEVEIETTGRSALHDVEAAAGRLLARLRSTTTTEPADASPTFGFARDLDGVALDSNTERADPYDDGRDQDDEDDDA